MDDPRCFELLGFDLLCDNTGRCHLLEANASPNLVLDGAVDIALKPRLLMDVFRLLSSGANAC